MLEYFSYHDLLIDIIEHGLKDSKFIDFGIGGKWGSFDEDKETYKVDHHYYFDSGGYNIMVSVEDKLSSMTYPGSSIISTKHPNYFKGSAVGMLCGVQPISNVYFNRDFYLMCRLFLYFDPNFINTDLYKQQTTAYFKGDLEKTKRKFWYKYVKNHEHHVIPLIKCGLGDYLPKKYDTLKTTLNYNLI